MAETEVTTQWLQAFADAWNRHDAGALMTFMTDDCVFEASAGPDVCGARFEGQEAVRAAFAEVWATFPDAHWGDARHLVDGDRGVSEWTFTGTRRDGTRVEVQGCDLFRFRDGKIALKNSYRKDRPPLGLPAATGAANTPAAVTPASYANEPVRFAPLQVVNLASEAAAVLEPYRNQVISRVNGSCLRLAVFDDVFRWHHHPASDELFLVVEGTLAIDLEDGTELKLGPWQAVTIPAGTIHRTRAIGRTVNLCVEELAADTVFVDAPGAGRS